MTRQERAKQFMPFDAMKGLSEALRDREERCCRVERHDISDEMQRQNSSVFLKLEKCDRVITECWHAFHDVVLEGRVTEISTAFKYLRLDDKKIMFEDVYSIRIIDHGQ